MRMLLACAALLIPASAWAGICGETNNPLVHARIATFVYIGLESGLKSAFENHFNGGPCGPVTVTVSAGIISWSWPTCGSSYTGYARSTCLGAIGGPPTCGAGAPLVRFSRPSFLYIGPKAGLAPALETFLNATSGTCGTVVAMNDCTDCNQLCFARSNCSGVICETFGWECPDAGCFGSSCNDNKPCTVDSCNQQTQTCAHTFNPMGCTCSTITPPTISAMGELTVPFGSLQCRALSGTLSASGRVAFMGSIAGPTCGNNCEGTATGSATANISINLCSRPISLTTSGMYTLRNNYMPECNPGTCSDGCGSGYCARDTASANASVTLTRDLGTQWAKSFSGGSAVVKCSASASLTGTVALTKGKVSNRGDTRGTCINCETQSGTLSAGSGASADCVINLSFRGASAELGCKKCAAIDVETTGGATGQSGSCPGQLCSTLKAKVSAAANLPKMSLQRKWWKVEGKCGASMSTCSELNSCGTACTCSGGGSCDEREAKITCSVCGVFSGLELCAEGA